MAATILILNIAGQVNSMHTLPLLDVLIALVWLNGPSILWTALGGHKKIALQATSFTTGQPFLAQPLKNGIPRGIFQKQMSSSIRENGPLTGEIDCLKKCRSEKFSPVTSR